MISKLFCVLVFASALDARAYRGFHFGGAIDCDIPSLEHGRVRTLPRYRNIIKFKCLIKYNLVGNTYATCKDGSWDEPVPVCVKSSPNCPIESLENGIVIPTYDNAYVTFFCLPEFKMVGDSTLYCDGRRWVGQTPQCVNGSTPAVLSCDFESPDLCGWRQDELHDFDWRRWNMKTPSSVLHTGPDSDHTLGKNHSGYYMYIESTSQTENSSARLLSPIYERKLSMNGCFKFYYHMYGDTTGGLRVFQKPDNMSLARLLYLNATERYRYTLFERWGNQGKDWHEFSGKLMDLGDNFQIVIQGIRGPDFLSDIAIDDVEIKGENCTASDTYVYTATVSPSELCSGRCMQNDTENSICGCAFDCNLNGNCCLDFFEACIFPDFRFMFPYDDQPSSVSIGEMMPQTEKLVGTTPSVATDKEITTTSTTLEIVHIPPKLPVTTAKLPVTTAKLPVTTAKLPVATAKLPVTTAKLPVTTPKLPVTTPKFPVTTPKLPVTTAKLPVTTAKLPVTTAKLPVTTAKLPVPLPIKTTLPTPIAKATVITMLTTKKTIRTLVFKTTEAIIKHEDTIEKATVKPVDLKPVIAKGVTRKPVSLTTVTAKVVTVKLTTVKPQMTTVLNKERSSVESKSKGKIAIKVITNKNAGISTTCLVLLSLGTVGAVGVAVWLALRGRAHMRRRSAQDPEVRYLTAHVDEE